MCKPLLLKNAASSKHSNTKLTSVRKFIQSNATGASSMNGRVRSLFRTMTTPRAKNTRKTITDPNVGSKSLNLRVRPELAESVVAAAESVARFVSSGTSGAAAGGDAAANVGGGPTGDVGMRGGGCTSFGALGGSMAANTVIIARVRRKSNLNVVTVRLLKQCTHDVVLWCEEKQ